MNWRRWQLNILVTVRTTKLPFNVPSYTAEFLGNTVFSLSILRARVSAQFACHVCVFSLLAFPLSLILLLFPLFFFPIYFRSLPVISFSFSLYSSFCLYYLNVFPCSVILLYLFLYLSFFFIFASFVIYVFPFVFFFFHVLFLPFVSSLARNNH